MRTRGRRADLALDARVARAERWSALLGRRRRQREGERLRVGAGAQRVGGGDRLLEADGHDFVGHGGRPRLEHAERAAVDAQRRRQRESAVDEAPGRGRARVGDAQRRVAGAGDDGGGRRGRVSRATPGVNAPNDAGAPSVQRQRRGHRAAHAALADRGERPLRLGRGLVRPRLVDVPAAVDRGDLDRRVAGAEDPRPEGLAGRLAGQRLRQHAAVERLTGHRDAGEPQHRRRDVGVAGGHVADAAADVRAPRHQRVVDVPRAHRAVLGRRAGDRAGRAAARVGRAARDAVGCSAARTTGS